MAYAGGEAELGGESGVQHGRGAEKLKFEIRMMNQIRSLNDENWDRNEVP